MGRFFTKAQRKALHERAGGQCEGVGPTVGLPEGARCMNKLGSTWVADHIEPYECGGPTEIENGQALCVQCNVFKTGKGDIPRIAKNTAVREKAQGIRCTKKKMPHGKDSPTKMKVGGKVVPRW